MKLYDIALASKPLQKLIGQDLPLRQAYALAILATKLNPSLEFYGNQLMSGRPQEELNELEAELPEFKRIKLPIDLDLRLSAGDIKCLEPFVEFEGVDEA
jgi:hypothetical protein|nr:MAG TPA: hypothetical protein [Caudoviricetes sp.]